MHTFQIGLSFIFSPGNYVCELQRGSGKVNGAETPISEAEEAEDEADSWRYRSTSLILHNRRKLAHTSRYLCQVQAWQGQGHQGDAAAGASTVINRTRKVGARHHHHHNHHRVRLRSGSYGNLLQVPGISR